MIDVGEAFYEGKAKVLHRTADPERIVHYFKDDATAFNRQKFGRIDGKGAINLRITVALFRLLEQHGIATHLVEALDDRRLLTRRVDVIPLEVVVRNRVAGTFAKRYGLEEGQDLPHPIVEFFYKQDALGDPLITAEAAIALGWATDVEVKVLDATARRIDNILVGFFRERGIDLIDFKLEFGRAVDGSILLVDEISPDSCRFWDAATGFKLDKDRFRRDLGGVEAAYLEMLTRIEGPPTQGTLSEP